MMKYFLLFLLFIAGISISNSQNSLDELLKKYNTGTIPYISVEELRMHQLDMEVLILDTRSPEEFKVSHLEESFFVGYDDFDISALQEIPKTKNIVVYCSVGIRSEKIAKKLLKAGYKNVQNLYGGIFEWKNSGYPVIDPDSQETEKVHAFSKHWAKWLNNAEIVY